MARAAFRDFLFRPPIRSVGCGTVRFRRRHKFEQHLTLGRHATDEFYGRRVARTAKPYVCRVEPEKTLNVALRLRVERNEEYLKRHAALDAELEKALALPENNGFKAQLGVRGGQEQFYRQLDRHVSSSQYTSDECQQTLRTLNMTCSMSRTGCCYDNAVMERLYWLLKYEWTKFETFDDITQARLSVFQYIETFYNSKRIH